MEDICERCGKDRAEYTRRCRQCGGYIRYHHHCLPLPTNTDGLCRGGACIPNGDYIKKHKK